MRLAVFGSTGPTGRLVVKQALAQGDTVVAYARNPSKLGIRDEHLVVLRGELDDLAGIEHAIEGADAVISILGPRRGQKGRPIEVGTKNIIAAMEKLGVRRLIVASTASAKDPNDRPEFRFMVGFIKLIARSSYDDIVATAEVVRHSNVDWTMVRLAILNNGPMTGKVKAGYIGRGEVSTSTTRADIADFMLKQVRNQKYLGQAPLISN